MVNELRNKSQWVEAVLLPCFMGHSEIANIRLPQNFQAKDATSSCTDHSLYAPKNTLQR